MGKTSKKVIDRIENENIKPIGRWSFVLKNSFLWTLFGLNILFGSIGLAITIYLFEMSDIFNLILSVNDLVEVLILAIPGIWILLTIVFLIVGYLNFRYTERGYMFSLPRIFLINILAILLLGIFLHSTNASERLNSVFSEAISTYNQVVDPRYKVWNRPDQGYIAGEILSVDEKEMGNGSESLQMEDLDKNRWDVDISDARIRRPVVLEQGQKIKVKGNALDENTFEASDVLPWEGGRARMQENHP